MNKKLLITLIILILFALGIIGGYFGYKYYKLSSVEEGLLAVVGNEKIYQEDLNERIYGLNFKGTIDNPEDVDLEKKKELLQSLIEWKILDQEAEKNNITVSDEEIQDYIAENNTSFESATSEQKDVIKKGARYNLLSEKIKERTADLKEGGYIIAHFDRNLGIPAAPEDREEWEKTSEEEREQKYQEEKKYAEEMMGNIHQRIKDEEIEFIDGMFMANSNPKVGAESFGTMSVLKSESFNYEDIENGTKALFLKEVKEKALELSAGEMSEPFKVNVDVGIEESEWKEGLIFILKITQGEKGTGSYEDWLNNKKNEYEVEIYNEELACLEDELFKNAAYAGEIGCDAGKWGVNTGLSSSSGGLNVHTNVRSIDGTTTWPLNDIGIKVEAVDKGGSSGSAILRWGSSPTCSSMVEDRNLQENFHTGGKMFMGPMSNVGRCNPGSTDNWCGAASWMVMGYGNSNHHGIGYTLDCDWNYKITPMVSGSGLGHWELGSITIGAVNGGTVSITLTWRQDPIPEEPGGGTTNLQCVLQAIQPPAGGNANPGTQVWYRVIVRNWGNAAAQNVIVEIPLPEGTTFNSMSDGCSGSNCGKIIDRGYNFSNIPTFGTREHAYWWFSEIPKQGDPNWEWGEMTFSVTVKDPPTHTQIENRAQARKADNTEIKISNTITHNIPQPPTIQSINTYCDGADSKAQINWTGEPHDWGWLNGFVIYVYNGSVSYRKNFATSVGGSFSTIVPDGFLKDGDMPPLGFGSGWNVGIYGKGDIRSTTASFTAADCTDINTLMISTQRQINTDGTITPDTEGDITWDYSITGPGYSNSIQITTSDGIDVGFSDLITDLEPGNYEIIATGVSSGSLDDWETDPPPPERKRTVTLGAANINGTAMFTNTRTTSSSGPTWWPFWREVAP